MVLHVHECVFTDGDIGNSGDGSSVVLSNEPVADLTGIQCILWLYSKAQNDELLLDYCYHSNFDLVYNINNDTWCCVCITSEND